MGSSVSDVLEGVRQYIRAKSAARHGGKSAGDAESLFRLGLIDSLEIFELVTFLEDRFGVEVRDEEIVRKNFESIQRIAAFVSAKLTSSGESPAISAHGPGPG